MRQEGFLLEKSKPFGKHPAKIDYGLAEILVKDYTSKGQWLLDPLAGCGTIPACASSLGRRGIGVELENHFKLPFDCLRGNTFSLPFKDGRFDAIITSPPYGESVGRSGDRDILKSKANKERYEKKRFGKVLSSHAFYGTDPNNLGSMPLVSTVRDSFVRAIPRAVGEWWRVLKDSGLMVLVVKDQRRGRKSLGLFDMSGFFVRLCQESGFVFIERRVAIVPESSWTLWMRINGSRWGCPVPNCEHVLVFRKGAILA